MEMETERPIRAFISYRRKGGNALAYILHGRLTELGVSCFYDMDSMRHYSDDFPTYIGAELERCDYVIALLSPGCLEERVDLEKDYFIEELRRAFASGKEIICLPTTPDFNWEDERIPEDIKQIARLNLMTHVSLQSIDATVEELLLRFSKDDRNGRPLMLHRILREARSSQQAAVVQNVGSITAVVIDERWSHAKRVSLLAIGCQGIITRFFSTVQSKYRQGVQFRFVSVDPASDAADDIVQSKVNSARYGKATNYLEECVASAAESLSVISREPSATGSIEYRLTPYAPTCTIQWVECEHQCESYFFIELIPLFGQNEQQDLNAGFIVQHGSPSYQYYMRQFEQCWEHASVRFTTRSSSDASCEFCTLNAEGNDYVLFRAHYWTVYLADNQNYPGRLIIPLNRHADSLSSLTEEEWFELRRIVRVSETVLRDELGATNFNWTCLMNGGYGNKPYNPHVHMHLIPRYDHDLTDLETAFHDKLFGNHYTLSVDYQLTDAERADLTARLRDAIRDAWL